MNRNQKINFVAFVLFFVVAVVVSNLLAMGLLERSHKPWHMQLSIDENDLADEYRVTYAILNKSQVARQLEDSAFREVHVLVDAWGVPFERKVIQEDFAIFDSLNHKVYLHERIANRTRHAEFVELKNLSGEGIYFFGGDSLEYGRNLYIDSLGYDEKVFCQRCKDAIMFEKLDSVLQVSDKRVFAITTQDSRDGVREHLEETLKGIAEVAKKHPSVRFIVQGTHRPILGDPKIRREHYAKWVPVVILN